MLVLPSKKNILYVFLEFSVHSFFVRPLHSVVSETLFNSNDMRETFIFELFHNIVCPVIGGSREFELYFLADFSRHILHSSVARQHLSPLIVTGTEETADLETADLHPTGTSTKHKTTSQDYHSYRRCQRAPTFTADC
jgi:hypothetical protein